MIEWIKRLFMKKGSQQRTVPDGIASITCWVRDEKGVADLYVNGVKTTTKLLIWDKEDIERLQQIAKKLQTEQ